MNPNIAVISIMNDRFEKQSFPVPANEFARAKALGELDPDYLDLSRSMTDLSRLAAKIAGTKISLINLLDHFTQWNISAFGMEVERLPREESVCQYTVMEVETEEFEVKNLAEDERFSSRDYVRDQPNLRYYYGIPLKVSKDLSIGALCVMDTEMKDLTAEKREMLAIVAKEIVNRMKANKQLEEMKQRIVTMTQVKNRLAHDIRGPIGGIIGLADIIENQGEENEMEEMMEFLGLIKKSSKSILDLANEILTQDKEQQAQNSDQLLASAQWTLAELKQKLEDMFFPQAKSKSVRLEILVEGTHVTPTFPRNKILQILGNLISNSIKFTAPSGKIVVRLAWHVEGSQKTLQFAVQDSGEGMSAEKLHEIMQGSGSSTLGTQGESGYGFGMKLVLHLVKSLEGQMTCESAPGEGTLIQIRIPVS